MTTKTEERRLLESAETLANLLEYNPYHDEAGRFTDDGGAKTTVAYGGRATGEGGRKGAAERRSLDDATGNSPRLMQQRRELSQTDDPGMAAADHAAAARKRGSREERRDAMAELRARAAERKQVAKKGVVGRARELQSGKGWTKGKAKVATSGRGGPKVVEVDGITHPSGLTVHKSPNSSTYAVSEPSGQMIVGDIKDQATALRAAKSLVDSRANWRNVADIVNKAGRERETQAIRDIVDRVRTEILSQKTLSGQSAEPHARLGGKAYGDMTPMERAQYARDRAGYKPPSYYAEHPLPAQPAKPKKRRAGGSRQHPQSARQSGWAGPSGG